MLAVAAVSASDWPRLLQTAQAGDDARFFILDEGDLSVFDLRTHARQVAVREGRLDLVLVDYLQLMRADPQVAPAPRPSARSAVV